MYWINQAGSETYTFIENTELNREACTEAKIVLNGIETADLDWATAEDIASMTIDTDDGLLEGLYHVQRFEGDNIEEFKLSMCYLDEPSQITVSSEQAVFYVDTATALSDGSEINSIEISPLASTVISDPAAI